MRRREITGSIALGGLVLLVALLALRFDLVPVHPVTKINFDGQVHAPGVDRGRLRRAVVDRFGLSPLLSRIAEIERTVQDALRESGYLNASVRARYDLGHSPERATLTLTIDPGSRTRVGSVDVVGTPTVPKQELLNRLHLTLDVALLRKRLPRRLRRRIVFLF